MGEIDDNNFSDIPSRFLEPEVYSPEQCTTQNNIKF